MTQETMRKWVVHNGTIQHKIGHIIVDDCSFISVNHAKAVTHMLNKAYELGRQDEFDDNAKRGHKLMEELGI